MAYDTKAVEENTAMKRAHEKALRQNTAITRRLNRAERMANREKAIELVRPLGYNRVMNTRTEDDITVYHDPYTGRTAVFKVRGDGRLTSKQVADAVSEVGERVNLYSDRRRRASVTYPTHPTPDQMAAWMRHPNKYDIEGIDTPSSRTPVAVAVKPVAQVIDKKHGKKATFFKSKNLYPEDLEDWY